MPREKNFTFIQESQLASKRVGNKHVASVNGKHAQLRFSKEYIMDNKLDGKYVKLHADKSKRAIGWTFLREKELGKLKGYRKLTLNNKLVGGYPTLTCTLHIGVLLRSMGIKDGSWVQLPIEKFTEPGLLDTKTYHYVELNDEHKTTGGRKTIVSR